MKHTTHAAPQRVLPRRSSPFPSLLEPTTDIGRVNASLRADPVARQVTAIQHGPDRSLADRELLREASDRVEGLVKPIRNVVLQPTLRSIERSAHGLRRDRHAPALQALEADASFAALCRWPAARCASVGLSTAITGGCLSQGTITSTTPVSVWRISRIVERSVLDVPEALPRARRRLSPRDRWARNRTCPKSPRAATRGRGSSGRPPIRL